MTKRTNYALFITSLVATLLFTIAYTAKDIYGNPVQLGLLTFYVVFTFIILTTALTNSRKGPRIAMLVFIVQLINILYISFALSFTRSLLLIIVSGVGFLLASRNVSASTRSKNRPPQAQEPTPVILTPYDIKNKNDRPRITIAQKNKTARNKTKKTKTKSTRKNTTKKVVKKKAAKKKTTAKKTVKTKTSKPKAAKKKKTTKKTVKKTSNKKPYRGKPAKRSR